MGSIQRVGLTAEWVGIAEAADQETVSSVLAAEGMRYVGGRQGWHWASRRELLSELDATVARVTRVCQQPGFGGWVADSDCAYLVFADPNGDVVARVAINETLPFGRRHHGTSQLWNDLAMRQDAFERVACWSERWAHTTMDVRALMHEMPGVPGATVPPDANRYGELSPWISRDGIQEWAMAEDGVWVLYNRLAIIGLDSAVL